MLNIKGKDIKPIVMILVTVILVCLSLDSYRMSYVESPLLNMIEAVFFVLLALLSSNFIDFYVVVKGEK